MACERAGLGIVLVYLMCQPAMGHGLFVSPSTPVSPPVGFEWLAAAAWVTILVVNVLLLRRVGALRWWAAIRLGALVAVGFAAALYLTGALHGELTTGPPTAPRPPQPVFWGFGWRQQGEMFAAWNLTGLLILQCICASVLLGLAYGRHAIWGIGIGLGIGLSLIVFLGPLALPWLAGLLLYLILRVMACGTNGRKRLSLTLWGNLAVYALALVPYTVTGALSHGRGGSYTFGDCTDQMDVIAKALVAYAQRHDGKLPQASSMEELMPGIQSDLPDEYVRCRTSVWVCPLGAAYERRPRPYEWNPRYSNAPAASVPGNPEKEDDWVLRCPYHGETKSRGETQTWRVNGQLKASEPLMQKVAPGTFPRPSSN